MFKQGSKFKLWEPVIFQLRHLKHMLAFLQLSKNFIRNNFVPVYRSFTLKIDIIPKVFLRSNFNIYC